MAASKPDTMGNLAIGSSLIGGIASSYASYKNAQTQQALMQYQSQVAANNAVIAESQARMAEQVGQQNVQATEMRSAQLESTQRAAMGASGVALDSGSSENVLGSTEYFGQRDAATVQHNADMQAWADRNQAQNFQSSAATDSSMASSINPTAQMSATALAGAGQFARTWYMARGLDPNNPNYLPQG